MLLEGWGSAVLVVGEPKRLNGWWTLHWTELGGRGGSPWYFYWVRGTDSEIGCVCNSHTVPTETLALGGCLSLPSRFSHVRISMGRHVHVAGAFAELNRDTYQLLHALSVGQVL